MQYAITLRGERARLLRQLLERHATELAARKNALRSSVEGVDAVEDVSRLPGAARSGERRVPDPGLMPTP
jgi:hypothetical protein